MKRDIVALVAVFLLGLILGTALVAELAGSVLDEERVTQFYRGAYAMCYEIGRNGDFSEPDVVSTCQTILRQIQEDQLHLETKPGWEENRIIPGSLRTEVSA